MAAEMRSLVCWDNKNVDGHHNCAAPNCCCPCHKAGEGPLMAEPLDLDAPLREQQHRVNVQQAQAWLRNATNLENRQPTTDLAREVVALASEMAEARAALQRVRKGQSLRRDFCTCKEHGIGGVFDASDCPLHDPHRKV